MAVVMEVYCVKLSATDIALMIDALWQAEVVLRDIDDTRPTLEFVSELRAEQRNLARRLQAILEGQVGRAA